MPNEKLWSEQYPQLVAGLNRLCIYYKQSVMCTAVSFLTYTITCLELYVHVLDVGHPCISLHVAWPGDGSYTETSVNRVLCAPAIEFHCCNSHAKGCTLSLSLCTVLLQVIGERDTHTHTHTHTIFYLSNSLFTLDLQTPSQWVLVITLSKSSAMMANSRGIVCVCVCVQSL